MPKYTREEWERIIENDKKWKQQEKNDKGWWKWLIPFGILDFLHFFVIGHHD